jgi:hypothetical protein
MRDGKNRYRGLPPRTPDLLFQIVRKFYRGAVSHYDLIQEKKAEVGRAYRRYRADGDPGPLQQALTTLFLEFHFYLTCWLQIELALYRLARTEETKQLEAVMERFRGVLERHIAVREQLERTEECVGMQWAQFGRQLSCVERDSYWFGGILFTVDELSLASLHSLYGAIMAQKPQPEQTKT